MRFVAARYDAHHEKIRNIFGAIARVYDPMNRIITLGLWGSWQRRFLDSVAPRDGEVCLDIATGTGDVVDVASCGLNAAAIRSARALARASASASRWMAPSHQ